MTALVALVIVADRRVRRRIEEDRAVEAATDGKLFSKMVRH